MRYKKLVTMMLVSVFLLTTLSSIANAGPTLISSVFNDTGTIHQRKDVSGKSYYYIKADNGYDYKGRHYDIYYPLNLGAEFKVDGLRVKFRASVYSIDQIITCFITRPAQYDTKNTRYLPIRILEMEKISDEIKEVVLVLNAEPLTLTQHVLSLDPAPIRFIPILDGKIHAVYEMGTQVTITVLNEYGNYIFYRWSGAVSYISSKTNINVIMNADKTITAHFKIKAAISTGQGS